jgi:hypothetical protein
MIHEFDIISIVCPGHTRPLAELQFIDIQDELPPLDGGSTNGGGGGTVSRTLLVSAQAQHGVCRQIQLP